MKSIKLFILLAFTTFLVAKNLPAQVIVTTPEYPVENDSVTIIFDASLGNAELKDVAPPIYAHTGVITNLSTSATDWKYVIAGWNENTTKAQMSPLGNNKYKLRIIPSIRSFYGVPVSEQILKLAFVFRNSNGTKVGRNADGSDIFADVYPSVTTVRILLPTSKNLYLLQNDTIPVAAQSPLADTMKIFVNGTLVKTAAGKGITDSILADNFGQDWVKYWVKIVATNDTATAADSFSYTILPSPAIADMPAGTIAGINYINPTTVVLALFAPLKNHVFALGDFNNWQMDSAYYMKKTTDGMHYWIQVSNLTPKKEYIFQYLVDGTLRIGDPFADKVSDPDDQYIPASTYPGLLPYPSGKTSGIATYLQTDQDPYPWNSNTFNPPAVTDLIIYELLIRDFTAKHDYPSLIDTLDYLKRLGVNAIELMPVMEFEGNISWGYNPDYSFAVDKYYGTKNGLKQFVEAAHAKGIAVILDIVCNHHFGNSPLVKLYWDATAQRPAANSPWFNPIPKHPYNVGYDFNHESTYTKTYMERLVKYWLNEFHVDGFRFDLSKGFTQKNSYPNNVALWGQYDASRISILNNYANYIRSVKTNAYIILEHFADNTEEVVLAGNGMMLWGNMNGSYINASGGWNSNNNSDLSWVSYKKRGWSQPNLVGYMESHDEERVMYRNITTGNSSKPPYNVKDTTTGLKRIELAVNFFYTIPGPKMLWQFGELGYDYSINYPTGTSDSRLTPKPIRWDYYDQVRRRHVNNVFSVLMNLKKSQPVFKTTDYFIDLTSAVKRVWLHHTTMDVTVLGNFDVVDQNADPAFTKTGMWYEYYTGDSLDVQDQNATLLMKPGEYRLYSTVRLAKPILAGSEELSLPVMLRHMLVYPNPSSSEFNLLVMLEKQTPVTLLIYDLNGIVRKVIFQGTLPAGVNTLKWDPAADPAGKAAPGIYFYHLVAGDIRETGKLILN
ncbi:MAG: alpha-amylase family glycosyl hydrolase [bacterium]